MLRSEEGPERRLKRAALSVKACIVGCAKLSQPAMNAAVLEQKQTPLNGRCRFGATNQAQHYHRRMSLAVVERLRGECIVTL